MSKVDRLKHLRTPEVRAKANATRRKTYAARKRAAAAAATAPASNGAAAEEHFPLALIPERTPREALPRSKPAKQHLLRRASEVEPLIIEIGGFRLTIERS